MAEAYQVQLGLLEHYLVAGDRHAGWKVGLTAKAMQEQQRVHEPVFGFLLESGHRDSGAVLPFPELIRPGFENELCITVGRTLTGPKVTLAQARSAIALVAPALEIVERRGDFTADLHLALADNAAAPQPTRGPLRPWSRSTIRVTRLLRRCGRLREAPSPTDPVAEQMPPLAGYAAASIQELLAAGPRAGQPVRRLRTAAAVVDEATLRCARLEGFSLHANVALPAHAREPLEHLCRYLLRPPLATDRLTESSGGQILYELPHARRNGSTHLLLDPLVLVEKHGVLIPRAGFTCFAFTACWPPVPSFAPQWSREIGRASCRESVWSWGLE